MDTRNYLVLSHAHPDFSIGGAEIAAYNLFKALRSLLPDNDVTFLARTDEPSQPAGSIVWRRDGEYLWRQEMGSWFYLQSGMPMSLYTDLRDFLLRIRPDVIFVQHYAHIGIEVFRAIRLALPNALIIATLHEYVAICNRNGQMLKRSPNRLCYEESLSDCHKCFPDISEQDFWLRKNYIKTHLRDVNHFVSPSEFLRSRYIDWGIQAEKISVIENGQPGPPAAMALSQVRTRQRFGYFGQVTEYKGLDVLLRAIHLIPRKLRAGAFFEVHGANLDHQGQWLKDLIEELRAPLIAEGVLRWAGPYTREEALRRISKVDWVIVPSIWWENSPMVIQEAFVCRKPVICSDIGGMAEKVRNEIDGLHFAVNDPASLAQVIAEAIGDPELCGKLGQHVEDPPSYIATASTYIQLVSRHCSMPNLATTIPADKETSFSTNDTNF